MTTGEQEALAKYRASIAHSLIRELEDVGVMIPVSMDAELHDLVQVWIKRVMDDMTVHLTAEH